MLRWPVRNAVLNTWRSFEQLATGRNAFDELLGATAAKAAAPAASALAPTGGSDIGEPIFIRDVSSRMLLKRSAKRARAALQKAVASGDKAAVEEQLSRLSHLQRLGLVFPALGAMRQDAWLTKRCQKTMERWLHDSVKECMSAGLAEPGATKGVHSSTFLQIKVEQSTQELIERLKQQQEAFGTAAGKAFKGKGSLQLEDDDLLGMTPKMRSVWESHFGSMAFWRKKYKVPISHPDLDRIMRYCQNRRTRERLFDAYYSGFGLEVNKAALELLRTRKDLAQKLGFRSWAHYQLNPLAVKEPTEAQRLLDNCWMHAQPNLAATLRQMESLAGHAPFKAAKNGPKTSLSQVDEKFFHSLVSRESDATWKLSEYFTVKDSLPMLLDLVGKAYNVVLKEVHDPAEDRWMIGWDHGVRIYKVFDKGGSAAEASPLGYVYLDLYARVSWLGRPNVALAGAFMICPGHVYVNMNYLRDMHNRLNDEQIVGIAHEFGHAVHALCMRGQGAPSFDDLPLDIGELPSVLAESIALHPGIMMQYAKHYDSKSAPTESLLLTGQRDVYFYLKFLQNYNVVLGLHGESFDPHSATPEEVQQTAVSLWQRYSPTLAHPSYSPFGGEAGLYMSNGPNHLAYLLCYLRVEHILFPGTATAATAQTRKGAPSWAKDAQRWVKPDFARKVREQLLDCTFASERLAAQRLPTLGGDPATVKHPLPPPPLDTACLFRRMPSPQQAAAA